MQVRAHARALSGSVVGVPYAAAHADAPPHRPHRVRGGSPCAVLRAVGGAAARVDRRDPLPEQARRAQREDRPYPRQDRSQEGRREDAVQRHRGLHEQDQPAAGADHDARRARGGAPARPRRQAGGARGGARRSALRARAARPAAAAAARGAGGPVDPPRRDLQGRQARHPHRRARIDRLRRPPRAHGVHPPDLRPGPPGHPLRPGRARGGDQHRGAALEARDAPAEDHRDGAVAARRDRGGEERARRDARRLREDARGQGGGAHQGARRPPRAAGGPRVDGGGVGEDRGEAARRPGQPRRRPRSGRAPGSSSGP